MVHKKFLKVFFVYLVAYLCDATITTYGIRNTSGTEGNPIVIWLWSIFGFDSVLLKTLYICVIFVISYILYYKVSKIIGLGLLFSVAYGHALGFLTWILFFNHEFNSQLVLSIHIFLTRDNGLYIVALAAGFLSALILNKLEKHSK